MNIFVGLGEKSLDRGFKGFRFGWSVSRPRHLVGRAPTSPKVFSSGRDKNEMYYANLLCLVSILWMI